MSNIKKDVGLSSDSPTEYVYINKKDLTNMQLIPIPKVLKDWYKVKYDSSFDYRDTKYNPKDKSFTKIVRAPQKSTRDLENEINELKLLVAELINKKGN